MRTMTGIACLAMLVFASSANEINLNTLSEPTFSTCPQHDDAMGADVLNHLRSKLISKNAKLLMSIITGGCGPEQTLRYNAYISSIYNPTLVASVFREAIDNLYTGERPEKLAAQLWSIYRVTDKASFELMLITQLQLFDKFIKRGDINSQYLLNVGYYFYKATKDPLFSQLNDQIKSDLRQAIEKLPITLNHFFFKSGFCLYSKGYQEYMYQADGMFYDSQRRYIFNWVPAGGEFSQGALDPVFHRSDNESADATPFEVVLRGRRFGKVMYMDESLENMVIAWEPGTQPKNAKWAVQYVQRENALVLSMGDRIMCASKRLYDYNERRYIYGMSNHTYSVDNGDCQWMALRCP